MLVLRGRGALAVVRSMVARELGGAGVLLPVRLLKHRGLDTEEVLDEALVLVHSEREVELHLHGGPAVVARVERQLEEQGVLGRGPGFEPWVGAGPIERAAALRLAAAPGDRAARVLLDQAQGALGTALSELQERDRAGDRKTVEAGLRRLLATWSVVRRLFVPPRVVLAGPANAGKSTLFNLLLGTERALVSGLAGTTRDALRQFGLLSSPGPADPRGAAWVIEWIDTAGERELARGPRGEQAVEAAGQALGRRAREEADLVLWLTRDAGDPPMLPGGVPTVAVTTCSDLQPTVPPRVQGALDRIVISALTDPEGAQRAVSALVQRSLGLVREPWRPGAPAPFTPSQAQLIQSALGAGPGSERRRLIGRLAAGSGTDESFPPSDQQEKIAPADPMGDLMD